MSVRLKFCVSMWVMMVVTLTACQRMEQESDISQCGGFSAATSTILYLPTFEEPAPPAYCDAEVLYWERRGDSVTFTTTRVLLNCCGEHAFEITQSDESHFELHRRDEPEGSGLVSSRCSCMCVYDFALSTPEVPAAVITMRLSQEVTDSEQGRHTIWEGELDLTQDKGFVVINTEDVGPWCGEQ